METTHSPQKTKEFVEKEFNEVLLPSLMNYVRIPNLSRAFDPSYLTNGLLLKAGSHIKDWIQAQNIKGLSIELLSPEGKTPLVFVTVEGNGEGAALLYGHFDKQPHMTGWDEGLNPTDPIIKDGKLYGRGAADDGYSGFGAILAIKTCQTLGLPHPRCVILLEADEESGSADLPYYLEVLKEKIGTPNTIFCLDSGAGDYDRLWLTTTLRGVICGNVKVKVLNEGVHSGDSSGVVPSSFRILRQLLNRLDNVETGLVNEAFHVNIPPERYEEAYNGYKLVTKELLGRMPWSGKTKPTTSDLFQAYLNRIWRPQLSVIGVDGMPPTQIAGNVLRPDTTVKLSLRIPPTLEPVQAEKDFISILETNPPYDSTITLENVRTGPGWNAPQISSELKESLKNASLAFFGQQHEAMGEGGSIPFMKMLSDIYPKSEFVVVGVLGPKSNAHGPNEFLHLDYCKKLICCIAQVLSDSVGFPKK